MHEPTYRVGKSSSWPGLCTSLLEHCGLVMNPTHGYLH